MHPLRATQVQPRPARLQELLALADQAAETGLDMREPELHPETQFVRSADSQSCNSTHMHLSGGAPSALEISARKDASVLSREKLVQKYGCTIADKAINAPKSQNPIIKQILGKRQHMRRVADAECGKAMAAAGIHVQQHSVQDYAHVIVTQLNLLQDGTAPSVAAVVIAAFPDNPAKAKSIQNSRHGRRRKQAYSSDVVRNHPTEMAMQLTLGKDGMNRRLTAGTFGQSLGINLAMFKSCDRIIALEARVQVLEEQMRSTRQREALADAGCTTSSEKVLALYGQGKRQTEISRLLSMSLNTVKSIIRRSKTH